MFRVVAMRQIPGYESTWMKRKQREPNYTILSTSKSKNDYNFHTPICRYANVQGAEKSDVYVIVHHWYNSINKQLDATIKIY